MRARANLRRFGHILAVVTRHAMVHVLSRRLARWPKLARRLCGPPLSGPDRFKLLIEEMGGTFIKFGQMLALQSDLLPLEYCRVLFSLFDSVAPFSYEEVEQAFREDLKRSPKEIFDSFDVHPLATGSIGQVHVAMLGQHKVAVKIRR
ncbi:MAG TPA: AarF/UbiB family protein, partial [Candidatus Angelobacter sp.]